MRATAVIPAAGSGRRMAGHTVKQFIKMADKPILYYTLRQFEVCPLVAEVIVVTREEDLARVAEEIVAAYGLRKINKVVSGGQERQESVYKGLQAIEGSPETVIIHDGARPFVSAELIASTLTARQSHEAVVAGVPLTATIKRVRDGFVLDTADREELWEIQTPQVFAFELIYTAHQQALSAGFKASDDAMLVERMGRKVFVVPGDKSNIKVTTADDLTLARHLIGD